MGVVVTRNGGDSVVMEVREVSAIQEAVERAVECCAPSYRNMRRLAFNFRVGLTEAISNAVLCGNGEDPRKRVRVELWTGGGEIRARITDQGFGFDPNAIPDPRTPENITEPGGRGIFLMRKLLDEVHFNASGNSVTLVLREAAGAESATSR